LQAYVSKPLQVPYSDQVTTELHIQGTFTIVNSERPALKIKPAKVPKRKHAIKDMDITKKKKKKKTIKKKK